MRYRGITIDKNFDFRFAVDEYAADDFESACEMIDDLHSRSFTHRGVLIEPSGELVDADGLGGFGFEIDGKEYRLTVTTRGNHVDVEAGRQTAIRLIDLLLG